jgi:hypothetical protein
MMHAGFNVLQKGGASKLEVLKVIENGEQMFVVYNQRMWIKAIENGEKTFVVYNQRMLIAVLDSARVFDPGVQSIQ